MNTHRKFLQQPCGYPSCPYRVRFLTLLVSGVTAALLAVLWTQTRHTEIPLHGRSPPAHQGGGFSLLDQQGQRVTLSMLRGRPVLILFGHTPCTDSCLDALTSAKEIADAFARKRVKPHILFITLDPDRNNLLRMRDFLAPYGRRFLGLTGRFRDIRHVAKEYGIPLPKADADLPNGYGFTPSAQTYLLDQAGILRQVYSPDTPAGLIIADINVLIQE